MLLTPKQKQIALSGAVSNAISIAVANQSHDQYAEGVESLFSLESLGSTTNYNTVVDTINNARAGVDKLVTELSGSLTGALSDIGQSDADPTAETIEVAQALFGSGLVKQMLGKENEGFSKVEALLSTAKEAMATTGLALGIGKNKTQAETELNALSNTGFSTESLQNAISGYAYGDEEGFSLENFDKFDPNRDMVINMMLSALSVVEPPICRLTYPTYRLQPGQNLVTLQIDREYLLGNNYRTRGKGFNRADIPLLEAYWDTQLFDDDRTSCIPVYSPETEHLFADPTLTGLKVKQDENGGEYKTGLLAFNKEVDFISVSGGRGEIKNRVQDRTDQLDPYFNLDVLGLKIKVGENDPVAVEVNVSSYPTALRQQALAGAVRKFQISFHEEILLSRPKNMKDGSEIAQLNDIYAAYKQIVLRVTSTLPEIDLTEATTLPSSNVAIVGLRRADGTVVSVSDEAAAELLKDLTIEPIGYSVNMRRTDTNFTNTGKELESRPERRSYPIGYAPRIQVRGPMGASDLEHAKLLDKGLTAITREKIVRSLSNKFDRLMVATDGGKGVVKDLASFKSSAFGNLVTIPTLRYHHYVPNTTKTLSHAQRMNDVRAHVINALRTQLAFVVDESRLRVVGRDFNKGSESIKIGMICDPKINQLLMVDGDNRLLTAAFDNFEIIEETADFFKNRIVCVFHVDSPYEISPVSNGFRAVGLSPVVKIDPDQTNAAKIQRIMTEPREVIVDTNEIMMVFEIEGLEDIMDVNAEVLNVVKP